MRPNVIYDKVKGETPWVPYPMGCACCEALLRHHLLLGAPSHFPRRNLPSPHWLSLSVRCRVVDWGGLSMVTATSARQWVYCGKSLISWRGIPSPHRHQRRVPKCATSTIFCITTPGSKITRTVSRYVVWRQCRGFTELFISPHLIGSRLNQSGGTTHEEAWSSDSFSVHDK